VEVEGRGERSLVFGLRDQLDGLGGDSCSSRVGVVLLGS